MQRFKTMPITAMAFLLMAAGSLAEEAGQASEPLAIEGEELADDPAHGMGQGDPAVASGNDMHSIDGQHGYVGLDDELKKKVTLIEGTGDWSPDDLIGATVVDPDGKALGEIADLLLDGEIMVRQALLALPGEASHVGIRVEDLTQEDGAFVLDGSVIDEQGIPAGDRFEPDGERWVPAEV